MGLLNEAFVLTEKYGDLSEDGLIPLPRTVAGELVLCATLAPLILTDIAVEVDDMVYATDASESRGAICSAFLGRDLTQLLYKSCRTNWAYTRLHQDVKVIESSFVDEHDDGASCTLQEPHAQRPLAFSFEFLEVFAGSSRISAALSKLGVVVGPPIDISFSEEFDLTKLHVLSWIFYLLESGKLLAIAVEPPCTTFSIMRRPALRSRLVLYGFDPCDAHTKVGNLLFLRALQIMKKASIHRAAGLLERPFSALSKFLPPYQRALAWPGACEVRVDSCQYGSIHQESFSLLGVNLDLPATARRCQGKCQRVTIQGVYTKASAIYTPELAAALAWTSQHSISLIKKLRAEELAGPVGGLENQLVNEIMVSSSWEVKKSWKFKKDAHINLLELKAVQKLVEDRARAGPARFVGLVDSNVSRCALGKGRSASRSISSVLRRIAPTLVAFGLYMVNPFCPTRLNVADDPTRCRPVRDASPGLNWRDLPIKTLWDLAEVKPTRKWASNWLRLKLLLSKLQVLPMAMSSSRLPLLDSPCLVFGPSGNAERCPQFVFHEIDFDSTLGFPGEGPPQATCCFGFLSSWTLPALLLLQLFSPFTLACGASSLSLGFPSAGVLALGFIPPAGAMFPVTGSV